MPAHRMPRVVPVPLVNSRWWEQGACRNDDPNLWQPLASGGRGKPNTAQARRDERCRTVCRGCPVIDACLADADLHTDDPSFRGGLTARQRGRRRAELRPTP